MDSDKKKQLDTLITHVTGATTSSSVTNAQVAKMCQLLEELLSAEETRSLAAEAALKVVASVTANGLMSSDDKTKLDGIESEAQKNPGVATTSSNGLMSATDKSMLDGSFKDVSGEWDRSSLGYMLTFTDNQDIETKLLIEGASEDFGGVMTPSQYTKLANIESGAQKNPSNATSSKAGLMSASDKTKLDLNGDLSFVLSYGTRTKEYSIDSGTYFISAKCLYKGGTSSSGIGLSLVASNSASETQLFYNRVEQGSELSLSADTFSNMTKLTLTAESLGAQDNFLVIELHLVKLS